MSSIEEIDKRRDYWRSLAQLEDTPRFRRLLETEFPDDVEDISQGPTRREFLKLMGASLALAGIGGCGWSEERILPFSQRPEGRVPGVPEHFATAMELAGVGQPLLGTSYDGRPVKLEGNPGHPEGLGATHVFAQASVLELYDPDRSKRVIQREGWQEFTRSWDDFHAFVRDHFEQLRREGGNGFRVLSEQSSSPSLRRLRAALSRVYPRADWYEYEPISWDAERSGARLAFGRPYRTHADLSRAKIIVSFDADFLKWHPDATRLAHDFAVGRRGDEGEMNRLYMVESAVTLTGAQADHRLAVPPSRVIHVLLQLAKKIIPSPGAGRVEFERALGPALGRYQADASLEPFVSAMAEDLLRHRGEGVVLAGARQPAQAHALVHLLNEAMGNTGRTVTYTPEEDPSRPPHLDGLSELVAEIRDDRVKTLFILGGNPLYDAPADSEFSRLLERVPTTIHLGLYRNETGRATTWHLPRAHYLESWGDARSYAGTISVVQPLIAPLYGGKSALEVVAMFLGADEADGLEIVRRTMEETFRQGHARGSFEPWWRKVRHDGFVEGSSYSTAAPRIDTRTLGRALEAILSTSPSSEERKIEIVFSPSGTTYDGRFANNAWLQELPDPLTRLTWGNAALLSPATAEMLGVENEERIELADGDRTLEVSAFFLPGMPRGTMALELGYGRTGAGSVGDGVGDDVYRLRTGAGMDMAAGITVRPTGTRRRLASTQNFHALGPVGDRAARERIPVLVREANLSEYRAHPDFVKHRTHDTAAAPLWKAHEYEGHRWAMTIDLSTCIGCGNCVIACQAENNIPVVGREQVMRGRAMHWIRVDRYFAGSREEPDIVFQPVTCHHCENAPCEQVCPVAATVHSSEGLNQMVYNRCLGTRYCANNCPYKVRRFNFFNYRRRLAESEKLVLNPEVTVRSRGVMEKCTFCIQRISAAKITAKKEGRPVRDGEIVPACAQVCPTGSIIFGDLSDQESRVRQLTGHPRAYEMLAELNVQARTRYLAKLRNPSPGLASGTIQWG